MLGMLSCSLKVSWEIDKGTTCAEAQKMERNRLETGKECRMTGRLSVLGSHIVCGPFIPWNFDTILWALRRQEGALSRMQALIIIIMFKKDHFNSSVDMGKAGGKVPVQALLQQSA